MKYKAFEIDKESSLHVYKKLKRVIKIKMCYNNVFNVITLENSMRKQFIDGDVKIAYGYIKILEDMNLYARHCFLLKDGKVIDPTVVIDEDRYVGKYYIFKEFGYNEYIAAICKDDREPGLYRFLQKEDSKISKEAINSGLIFIN